MSCDDYGLRLTARALEACGRELPIPDSNAPNDPRYADPDPDFLDNHDSRLGQALAMVRGRWPDGAVQTTAQTVRVGGNLGDQKVEYGWASIWTVFEGWERGAEAAGSYMVDKVGVNTEAVVEALLIAAIRAAGLSVPEREGEG